MSNIAISLKNIILIFLSTHPILYDTINFPVKHLLWLLCYSLYVSRCIESENITLDGKSERLYCCDDEVYAVNETTWTIWYTVPIIQYYGSLNRTYIFLRIVWKFPCRSIRPPLWRSRSHLMDFDAKENFINPIALNILDRRKERRYISR